MDCAAEERLVRMKIGDAPEVERLEFDLPARRLVVYHTGEAKPVGAALDSLGLGARQVGETEGAKGAPEALVEGQAPDEQRPLVAALAINAVFFVGELAAGLLAGSMGLVADSLDMLADSLVYALSLAAVGTAAAHKKRLARWSGYLQFGLAVFGLVEVVRRFISGEGVPNVTIMLIVAGLALLGNVATLVILNRAKRGEAHVEASWIFTSNDIKVNGLVIASGALVWATASRVPDLLAGGIIFLIVANGARQILALSR